MAAIVPGEGGSTNNPTFTGLLTTPALKLNSTEIIVSNSAPALRSDGSALVTGDLWYNSNTKVWGTWQSPYWLSAYQKTLSHDQQINLTSSGSSSQSHGIPSGGSVFVESVYCYSLVSNTNDGSNYWTITAGLAAVQNTSKATIGSFSTAADTPNLRVGKVNNANVAVPSDFPVNEGGLLLALEWTKVGSPGLFYFSVSFNYRDIL